MECPAWFKNWGDFKIILQAFVKLKMMKRN